MSYQLIKTELGYPLIQLPKVPFFSFRQWRKPSELLRYYRLVLGVKRLSSDFFGANMNAKDAIQNSTSTIVVQTVQVTKPVTMIVYLFMGGDFLLPMHIVINDNGTFKMSWGFDSISDLFEDGIVSEPVLADFYKQFPEFHGTEIGQRFVTYPIHRLPVFVEQPFCKFLYPQNSVYSPCLTIQVPSVPFLGQFVDWNKRSSTLLSWHYRRAFRFQFGLSDFVSSNFKLGEVLCGLSVLTV